MWNLTTALRVAGGYARYARSQGIFDSYQTLYVVSRWSNILGANRRHAIAKSSMLQENKLDVACMYIYTYIFLLIRTLIGTCLVVCCFMRGRLCYSCAVLCCAVLCCALLCSQLHTRTNYCCAAVLLLLLLYIGTAIPSATLVHKEAWIGITQIRFRCKQASCKYHELHAPRKTKGTQNARTYIFLLIRTPVGMCLVWCIVQRGDCAVLCCTSISTIYV